MRAKDGTPMMSVWQYLHYNGVFVVAYTRVEAAKLLACDPEDISRVKGVYATGVPRELK
jgi:hypothetical protein